MFILFVLSLVCVCLAQDERSNDITIDSLHVRSDIRHRYAVTLVTSQVSNMADFAQDVRFDFQLPQEAFISNFSMLIDDIVYPADIETKEKANERFEIAVQAGQSAAKVESISSRETNDFVVSVNVEAFGNVTFNLTYQELLRRRTGLYEHVIYINPGVPVPDFKVVVSINESRELTELTVPEIRGDRLSPSVIAGSNQYATISSADAFSAEVTFAPTILQQQQYSDIGVNGQFIVNYDVDHTLTPEGEILVSNGYFVHFFAPEDLPTIGKRIVFVLDVSGSMGGIKIQQLREAMVFILNQLREVDEFGILLFNSQVTRWASGELVPATPENVENAKGFAGRLRANGGTNINDALLVGLEMLGDHPTQPSLLLFLTDGQATSGVTQNSLILSNAKRSRTYRQSIYSLAFGAGADFGLLRTLSGQNKGLARQIYEDADASLQLVGFYNEISTPLLSEVFISYLNDSVNTDSITVTEIPTFFSGSEIVVAGQFRNNNNNNPSMRTTSDTDPVRVIIEGNKNDSNLFLLRTIRPTRLPCCVRPTPVVDPTPGPIQDRNDFVERLWVYLTIKQLIEKIVENDQANSTEEESRIVDLALKYGFVTPYTSLVVTKPNKTESLTERKQEVILNEKAAIVPAGQRALFGRTTTTTTRIPQTFSFFGTTTTTPRIPQTYFFTSQRPRTPPIFGTTTTTPRIPQTYFFTSQRPRTPPTYPTTNFPATHFSPRFPPTFRTFRPTTTVLPRPTRSTSIFGTTKTTTATTTPSTEPPTTPAFISDVASSINVDVMTDQGIETLCLDLTPSQAMDILLLSDLDSGLSLTGTLATYPGEHAKFAEIQMSLNGTPLAKINSREITLGQKTYRWWQVNSLNVDGVTVTQNDGVQLTPTGNLIVTFHKYGLETRRALLDPFVTVTLQNTEEISMNSVGLISSVFDLSDVRNLGNTLSFIQDGVLIDTSITVDETLEGGSCLRVHNPEYLNKIFRI